MKKSLPLNLRTNTGRCLPLPQPQECDPGPLPDFRDDSTVITRWTRPPPNSRACCAGPQDQAPQVTYEPVVTFCHSFRMESDVGNLALETDLGVLLQECADPDAYTPWP